MAKLQLSKNDVLTLTAQDIMQNGSAVCHTDSGFVVFVPAAAKSDVLKVKIIKVTKSYAVGKILEIIEPSPDRISDGCAYSSRCGGCAFWHIGYERECEFKKSAVKNAFSRIGKLDLRVEKFYGGKENHYRNKAVYPVGISKDGKAISGFYAPMSHRIVEHDDCLISNPVFSEIRDSVLGFVNQNGIPVYDEEKCTGILRSIHLRSAKSGDVSLTLIINGDVLVSKKAEADFVNYIIQKHSCIKTVLININKKSGNVILGKEWRTLFGDGYIYDELLGKKFRITPASFWQVNREQAEVLYSIAKEYADLKENDVLIDLYCGTGSVGICLAEKGVKLYGVEVIEQAAKDAEFNAKLNDTDGEFWAAETENALDDVRLSSLSPDVITVDPPRKGCVGAVEKIARLGAKRIVYISCDPATLARDLAEFEGFGYKAEKASAVDMFPRTGHVETVALLSQLKPDDVIQVELNSEDLALTSTEAKATYEEIKTFVKRVFGFKVSSLYIAQVKRKYGIEVGQNYNLSKKGSRVPICPQEKEDAIVEALRYFKMIK